MMTALTCAITVGAAAFLTSCADSQAPDDAASLPHPSSTASVRPAEQALENADVPKLDPATMFTAEIRKGIGDGPHCTFHYTRNGKPVLGVQLPENSDAQNVTAVVKLNTSLVQLRPPAQEVSENKIQLVAPPIRMTLSPDPRKVAAGQNAEPSVEATLELEIEDQLKAGYRGYLACTFEGATAASASR
ncbi:MAG: hypothetical protein KKB37_06400 [Alphaproteobacteria bacterium]|nr:hypothetical protein [Alphaproteobacteria bacterium]